jgi:CubicO group peptidase (beta-lactamase class C family)
MNAAWGMICCRAVNVLLQRAFPLAAALAVLLAAATGGSLAAAAEDSMDPAVSAKIDAIFSSAIEPNAPGAAVLVRRRGATFVRGYGVRDLQSMAKIDAHTSFRLASCTKQFTAMAVMLLMHDRKLRYDQALTEVFPDFPAYGKAITIRHLLNHTSGLADYESLMEQQEHPGGGRWSEQNQIQDAEVLALLMHQSSTIFPPGTQWAYSNSGYVLLGLVVAKLSGESFGDFLRERIFAPLKMEGTVAYEKNRNVVANRAYGHSRDGGAWKQTDQSSTSATLGDGGVYSSLVDLAKWDDALAHHILLGETELGAALIPATLSRGGQPKWPRDSDRPAGTPVAYGFGWFLDPYRGHARMWHYGDTRGFHAYIERFRDDRLTIVVLCNRTDLDPEKFAEQSADLFFAPSR